MCELIFGRDRPLLVCLFKRLLLFLYFYDFIDLHHLFAWTGIQTKKHRSFFSFGRHVNSETP